MVDCAYAEFADDDLTEMALGPNAVVFRTLVEGPGPGGTRVGFAAGSGVRHQRIERRHALQFQRHA